MDEREQSAPALAGVLDFAHSTSAVFGDVRK
jgi:hypothetical protein